MALGESLNVNQAVSPVNAASTGYKKHKSIAGDYLALGTVAQSISPLMLQKLKERMSEVKTILESGDQSKIAALTREDVLGNMHYATMLGYYAQYLGQSKMLQHASKVHELIIGYGTFGSEVRTADRFGLPVGIKAGGIGLDIPIGKVIVADNNDRQNFLNYRMQAGMIASSLEHQPPEQLYNTDPNNPIQGISTMKAFALANAQGQKMYTISKQNIDKVLPMIQASALTKGDIRNAVYAGKIVTVHEREVSVPGWHGTGYMVFDPANGNNAFMISGGGNGGFLEFASNAIYGFMSLLNYIYRYVTDSVLARLLGKVINTLGTIKTLIDTVMNCKNHGIGLALFMLSVVVIKTLLFVAVLILGFPGGLILLASSIALLPIGLEKLKDYACN